MAHVISLPEISEVIRVLAADSNIMSSQLLASALQRDSRFHVMEAAPDAESILSAITREKPSVLILSVEVNGNKGKVKSSTGKQVGCMIVRVADVSKPAQ